MIENDGIAVTSQLITKPGLNVSQLDTETDVEAENDMKKRAARRAETAQAGRLSLQFRINTASGRSIIGR
jgi:hypothetical protein